MARRVIRLGRLLRGHTRLFGAAALGVVVFAVAPLAVLRSRAILGWDAAALANLLLCASLFAGASPDRMESNAARQQEGEWSLFWLVVAGATASFAAILTEFGSMKGASAADRPLKVALVAATLALSWLLTHTMFALRYAHEFYTRDVSPDKVDGGLEFPGETKPDYWDFLYFSLVLGMTFQVSDVQITSRKLRRLAALHGLLGFLFNTVIVALTVNLASSLLT